MELDELASASWKSGGHARSMARTSNRAPHAGGASSSCSPNSPQFGGWAGGSPSGGPSHHSSLSGGWGYAASLSPSPSPSLREILEDEVQREQKVGSGGGGSQKGMASASGGGGGGVGSGSWGSSAPSAKGVSLAEFVKPRKGHRGSKNSTTPPQNTWAAEAANSGSPQAVTQAVSLATIQAEEQKNRCPEAARLAQRAQQSEAWRNRWMPISRPRTQRLVLGPCFSKTFPDGCVCVCIA